MIGLAVALHALAAVVWVGGMAFALWVLRPAAGPLEAPVRLALWQRAFERFFVWVWAAVVLLPATGHAMVEMQWGGFAGLPIYGHVMAGIGWLMVLVFLHLWFAPYRRFRQALAAGEPPKAAAALGQIRWLVTANLALGLINAAIGASGRYWTV